jgi:uncharacterized phage-associated protein
MNFRFDARKATQAAAAFAKREGGEMNVMKLVKLVYLLDRLSLLRRAIPVLGGDYFSMKNGPVTSEVLDLINAGALDGFPTDWASVFSDRAMHKIALERDPGDDRLSESELTMIAEVYTEHGRRSAFELVEWCHRNCAEWRPVTQGRHEIRVEDILEAGGRSPDYVARVVAEAAELRQLDAMLA